MATKVTHNALFEVQQMKLTHEFLRKRGNKSCEDIDLWCWRDWVIVCGFVC